MRLIDADKIDTRERGNNSQRTMWLQIKWIIDAAPTVDIVKQIFDEIEVYERDFSMGDMDGVAFMNAIDKMKEKYMENKND